MKSSTLRRRRTRLSGVGERYSPAERAWSRGTGGKRRVPDFDD